MRFHQWLRIVLLSLLVGVIAVPPGALSARTRSAAASPSFQDQQGPTKPPQSQPAQPPTPPTTQQQQEQKAQQQSQQGNQPQAAITSTANLVNIDAAVTDQEGDSSRI